MGILTHRRYRARLAARAVEEDQDAVASVHVATTESLPAGTPLPTDFPGRDLLAAATPTPYESYEDLYGAGQDELTRIDGIGPSTAQRIIDARDAWEAEQ